MGWNLQGWLYQKLPLFQKELVPATSRLDPLLPKVERISDSALKFPLKFLVLIKVFTVLYTLICPSEPRFQVEYGKYLFMICYYEN